MATAWWDRRSDHGAFSFASTPCVVIWPFVAVLRGSTEQKRSLAPWIAQGFLPLAKPAAARRAIAPIGEGRDRQLVPAGGARRDADAMCRFEHEVAMERSPKSSRDKVCSCATAGLFLVRSMCQFVSMVDDGGGGLGSMEVSVAVCHALCRATGDMSVQ